MMQKGFYFSLSTCRWHGLSAKRQLFVSLLIALSVLTSGCGLVGPASLKEGRKRYNQVVAFTNSEQMLMNLVKLKYRDKPTFLQVSSISMVSEISSVVTPCRRVSIRCITSENRRPSAALIHSN